VQQTSFLERAHGARPERIAQAAGGPASIAEAWDARLAALKRLAED
jgi:hypothetical protein